MKNKLLFRIFGALASSLIIVSVFIPFVSVTGYSQSLWETHQAIGTLYLPIMIIVFGLIGVIFFSINIKTELAYTSSGALLFFLITQTIPIINQGTFKTLGIGYYCLVIGTIITGLMAFLCNLRRKKTVVENNITNETSEVSVLNRIDKLYNNNDDLEPVVADNIIQPLPVENSIIPNEIQQVQPIIPVEPVPVQTTMEPIVQQNITIPEVDNDIVANNQHNFNQNVSVENNIENTMLINPVVAEFSSTQNTNMVNPVNQFSRPQVEPVIPPQPIEYPSEPIMEPNQNLNEPVEQINPVVSEFSMPRMFNSIAPQMENSNVNTQVDAQNKDNNLDIFG